jgi:hypothetical protein
LSDRKLKPLPPDPFRHQDSAIALRQLAIEAWLRDMKIGVVISEVIIGVIKGDLFQRVLDRIRS